MVSPVELSGIVGHRKRRLCAARVAFGIAPGVAEELLCRGFIQRGLQRRFGPAVAVVLAAVLFGALHIEPIHSVTAATLGVYLGVVCWLADSVRPAIVCHAINNCVAVASAAFGRTSGELQERADQPTPRGIAMAEGGHMIMGQGGVPIIRNGVVDGAVGVGGGTSQEDEDCAKAGIAKL